MPFTSHLLAALSLGIADGPTEVHKLTIAKAALKDVEPAEGLWPTGHLPARRAEARRRFAHLLEHEVGNQ
jgi:acyl-CoA dehydrogenase